MNKKDKTGKVVVEVTQSPFEITQFNELTIRTNPPSVCPVQPKTPENEIHLAWPSSSGVQQHSNGVSPSEL